MKRYLSILLAMTLSISLLAGCGNTSTGGSSSTESTATEEPSVTPTMDEDAAGEADAPDDAPEEEIEEPEPEGPDTLVVFFSRHGNNLEGVDAVSSATLSSNDVTILADMIVEATGEADLHQIITVEPYPTDYNESTQVARTELDVDARPALANSVENMDQYDVIYLGYPNWWSTIPMPVATFLESYDFSGKTIVPFCTHEGSRLGTSVEDIARLVPTATVLDGFEVSGNQADGARDSIEAWMRGLGLID